MLTNQVDKKVYISASLKGSLEKLQANSKKSWYEIALDIGISQTSLRTFLKGGGISEKSFKKIKKLIEGEKMTDEKFNEKMKQLEVWLSNIYLLFDTVQRESLYNCIKKAQKDIKDGDKISLEKHLLKTI